MKSCRPSGNHWYVADLPYGIFFAPLKTADVDEEGTLRLGWWKGNEKMKHQAIEVQDPGKSGAIRMLGNTFDVVGGGPQQSTRARRFPGVCTQNRKSHDLTQADSREVTQ